VHSDLASQLARDGQRDMLAQAGPQRLARQAVALAPALRRAERTERRMRTAARKALRLLSEPEQ
jgi:hypothetical protein